MIPPRLLAYRGEEKSRARSSGKDKLDVSVRLQVETEVTPASEKFLKRNGDKLVKIIEATGLKLEFSSSVTEGPTVHMYQIWDMDNDCNRLVQADLILPDEPAYAEFDVLILKETKNIVVPITPIDLLERHGLSSGQHSPDDHTKYVRIVHQVPHANLAEFSAKREANLVAFADETGWKPVDAYLSITGESGQVFPIVEIWRIPPKEETHANSAIVSTMRLAPWCKDKDDKHPDEIKVLGGQVLSITGSSN